MQVFGLPGHVARSAGRASRLLGAKPANVEETRRHDVVARWRRAMRDATDGRILSNLVERGRVTPVPDPIRKAGRRSPPKARPHAIRKPKDVAFEKPGDVIQINTLTLSLAPGRTVKHFDAYDVFAKTVAKPHRSATAANAADFLDKVTAEIPWPIKALQIDGGSQFMAESEKACQDKAIPLYVLPPKSPKLNGAVERCNRAWSYEFYATADLPSQIDKIAQHVDAFQHLYNHHDRMELSTASPQTSISKSTETDNQPVSYVLSAATLLHDQCCRL